MAAPASDSHAHVPSSTIIVNGTQEVWTDHQISYDQVVQLAFPGAQRDQLYTVSYSNLHGKDGTLVEAQITEVKNGTVFTVVKTNRS
jgi:hypothetical protein